MSGAEPIIDDMENLNLEDIPLHEINECTIVHPNGQTQTIRDCWCHVYHVFGKEIRSKHVNEIKIRDDIFCFILNPTAPIFSKFPGHQLMFQKFKIQTNGPVVFFRKGNAMTAQNAIQLFNA